jgi:hypothetical protein
MIQNSDAKWTYQVSTDKHQGPKKGPSARQEQRKASSGEKRPTTRFFFLQLNLDLGLQTPANSA